MSQDVNGIEGQDCREVRVRNGGRRGLELTELARLSGGVVASGKGAFVRFLAAVSALV
jgi:hypothetical protein